MPRDILSEQQININFVKAVQKHPSLYNFELPSYSRKDISDRAWEEVGKATNMTPSACRERWRNLRAVFMRTMRAPPRGTGKKKPYYLADVMQFVIPFMRPIAMTEANKEKRKQLREIEANKSEGEADKPILVEVDQIKVEMVEDGDTDWSSTHSVEEDKYPLKRPPPDDEIYSNKRVAQPSTMMQPSPMAQPSPAVVSSDNDPTISFLNSLLPELNEMNTAQFKNFKRRVLLLIDDIMTEIPSSSRLGEGQFIM